MNDILSAAEMEELTGTKIASKQEHILTKAHIFYWIRLDGTVRTTWYHVHNPHIERFMESPNYDAIS